MCVQIGLLISMIGDLEVKSNGEMVEMNCNIKKREGNKPSTLHKRGENNPLCPNAHLSSFPSLHNSRATADTPMTETALESDKFRAITAGETELTLSDVQ